MTQETKDLLKVTRSNKKIELGGIEELLIGDIVDFIIEEKIDSRALYIGSDEDSVLTFIGRDPKKTFVLIAGYDFKDLKISNRHIESTSDPVYSDEHNGDCCAQGQLIEFALKRGGYDEE